MPPPVGGRLKIRQMWFDQAPLFVGHLGADPIFTFLHHVPPSTGCDSYKSSDEKGLHQLLTKTVVELLLEKYTNLLLGSRSDSTLMIFIFADKSPDSTVP